jgi:uncharacterized protein YggE
MIKKFVMQSTFVTGLNMFLKHQISIVFLASIVWFAAPLRGETEATIDVSGSAEIYAIPDEVQVSASIDSRGKTVMEASDQNDKLVQSVLEYLKKSGIEERHIRTEYLSLRPEFPPSTQSYSPTSFVPGTLPPSVSPQQADSLRPIGYSAVRSFSIVIRDVAKFESVHKGMLQLGVNRIDGVQFRTSKLRKYRDDARLAAVKAAKEKATAMATELGVSLAGVKLIEERGGWHNAFSANNAQVAIPVDSENSSTGGEITIAANVRVVFFISNQGKVDSTPKLDEKKK